MKQSIYVVKIANKLYLDSKYYGLYQTTTTNIMNAYKFDSYDKAEKAAQKAINAEVIELLLIEKSEYELEIDSLRAANTQLQRERDEALTKLNNK